MSSESAEQESEWRRVRLPGLIAPGTLETIQSGIKGKVDENGRVQTDAVPDADRDLGTRLESVASI